MRMITLASGHQLASEARIFIDLKNVDASVRNARLCELIERDVPSVGGLMRQAGDQVHIDIANPSRPKGTDISQRLLRSVKSPDGFDLFVDK